HGCAPSMPNEGCEQSSVTSRRQSSLKNRCERMSKSVMPTTAGPVLGVLGGMGPAATADFLDKLAASTPAARDQEHIATLVYSDPTTPDRSDAMVAEGPDPLPALLHGIEFLSNAGVGAIAIPCNSAHFWYDQMQRATDAPILHIVDAVARSEERRVGTECQTGYAMRRD